MTAVLEAPLPRSKYELPTMSDDALRGLLPNKGLGKFILLDPVSPEFNRGSFCYMGYLVFSAMKALGCQIEIRENFCAADVDALPQADTDMFLIVLWNHTQIEHVLTLERFLPKGKVKVFGFYGMIQAQHLPMWDVAAPIIQRGMTTYYKNFRHFKQILLSDCDMHLKEYSGQVYPFFTTYGCPRGCSFCPTTLNLPPEHSTGGRIATPLAELFPILEEMIFEYGWNGFHFTDEDFYLDTERTHALVLWLGTAAARLKVMGKPGLQIITLGERHTVSQYVKKHGFQPLVDAGFKMIEIGLETAEEDLGKDMGKGGIKVCRKLAEESPIHILWLTMAFYPGETISSLNKTGAFMKEHGLELDQLYERILTNGTWGGLGQFCQYYEGFLRDAHGKQVHTSVDKVEQDGLVLTRRPLRLLPSFIPASFINDVIKSTPRPLLDSDYVWFDNYRIDPPNLHSAPVVGKTVGEIVKEQYSSPRDGYLAMAVSAKIGLIA